MSEEVINPNVFVYADESGHSGKNIFDESSPLYYQGAIVSVNDIEDKVKPVIEKYCREFNVERLHGFELGEERANTICNELFAVLDAFDWSFHCTVIEKRYIVATKFVDTLFDPFYNKSILPFWYELPLFRHILCLLIDELMDEPLAKEFWNSYLKDDIDNVILLCNQLIKKTSSINDKRLQEMTFDGLSYVINNKEEFTYLIGKKRSAYKEQTPNIIAFSSLLKYIHDFCSERNTLVKEFIHDKSDEFRGTMREYHRRFTGVKIEDTFFGSIPIMTRGERDILGEFNLESSLKNYSLQVTDLFLWLFQRESVNLNEIKEQLVCKSNEFFISRQMSNMIVDMEMYKVNTTFLSEDELSKGKEFIKNVEKVRVKSNEGKS